jgi:hypothetical protein
VAPSLVMKDMTESMTCGIRTADCLNPYCMGGGDSRQIVPPVTLFHRGRIVSEGNLTGKRVDTLTYYSSRLLRPNTGVWGILCLVPSSSRTLRRANREGSLTEECRK